MEASWLGVRATFDLARDDVSNARAALVELEALVPPPPPPLTNGQHDPPEPFLRAPAVRELLFVERVGTQMNKLVQDAAKGSGGGGALYTRAREVARLVVAILTRSARFYSASSLLPSHTNEFIVALCGVLHTDALLSFRVPQTSTPSPPIASCIVVVIHIDC